MKATLKTIAAVALFAFSAPAFAGGVTVADNGDSKLKIGAKFYVNVTSKKTDTQAGTQSKSVGAALDRAYLSVGYQFDETWSMGLTTDVAIESKVTNMSKRSSVYIKKAYLQGKLSPEFVLQAGVIGTPWIGHEEHLWKHRYVSKVFVDTYKLDSSADAGIALKGKLADGLVDYHITEINGAGYGNISKTNAVDLNARVGFKPVEGLTLDVQFRDGYKGTKTWDAVTQSNTPGIKHTLYQVMATYGTHDWRVGANYVNEKAKNQGTSINTKNNAYVAWGWANFGNGLGAFGRYEHLKVKQDGQTINPKTNRYVVGLDWQARKNVSFSLAYDYRKTKDANYTAGNFSKTTQYGLYSQVKF